MPKKQTSLLYRCIKAIVRLVYPKMEAVGVENLPEEPVIAVGNHAQMHGPMYLAPELRKLCIGRPIRFCAANPIGEERDRICRYLMEAITEMACSLPEHTVIPYHNIPKKSCPSSRAEAPRCEEAAPV